MTRTIPILGLMLLAGCGAFPFGVPLDNPLDLPAELQVVVADQARYAIAGDHPLRSVAPGTARDAIAQLNGCWGSYTAVEADNEWGDPAGDYYEVFAFDLAARRFRWTSYTNFPTNDEGRVYLGDQFDTLLVQTGEVESTSTAECRATVRATRLEFDPTLAILQEESESDDESIWLQRVTLDGEYLLLEYAIADCDAGTCTATGGGSAEVYRRVPCDYAAAAE